MDAQLTNNDSAWVGHKLADGMSADQIEEYLKSMVEMEKIVYEKENLSMKMRYIAPEEPKPPVAPVVPDSPQMSSLFNTVFKCILFIIEFGAFWLFISIIAFLVVTFSSLSDDVGDSIIYGSAGVIGTMYLIFVIHSIWTALVARKKVLEEYNKELENHKSETQKHQRSMEKFSQDRSLWEYRTLLWKQERKQLELSLEESRSTREQLYAAGILAPKYRNFAAVCTLLEYFQAGTCETMKEAYNKYDQELLLGHIINNLGKISSSLDEIKQNQLMLYSTLQSSNYLLDQLVRQSGDFYTQASQRLINMEQTTSNMNAQISEILQTSAITAYCSDEAQKELSFMRRMSQYNGIIEGS